MLTKRQKIDEFPGAIKTVIEEKGCLPEQVFNADKSALLWKRECPRGHLIVRKRSEHQDLRQEG